MAKVLTLFIEDTDIKILTANGEKVEKWVTAPLDPGMVKDGVVIEQDKVAKLLRDTLKTLNISARKVIIGLGGLQSLYRLVDLPVLPAAVLPEAVKHEAERLMPVSMSEVYVGYQTIPSVEKGMMRIFITTFPRDATDKLIRTAQKAGLNPYLMDLAPLGFYRALTVPKAIVIRTWTTSLDIVAVANRVPEVIRSLSLSDAPDSGPERLSVITDEIERTVAFYNSSHEADAMDSGTPVFVCGTLAEDTKSQNAIHDKLGYNISILKSPFQSNTSFDASSYMVNIGLALKALKPGYSLVSFNALPEAYRVKTVSPFNVVAAIAIIVGLSAVAIMAYLIVNTNGKIDTLRPQVDTAQSHVTQEQHALTALRAGVQQLQDEIAQVEAGTAALTARLNPMKASRVKLDKAQADLRQVMELKPPAVVLNSLSQTLDGITLSGASPTEQDIYKYARALRDGQRFTLVHVGTISQLTNVTTTTDNTISDNTTIVNMTGDNTTAASLPVENTVTTITFSFDFTLQ